MLGTTREMTREREWRRAHASFSRAVWLLNAAFFDEVRVRVRETSEAFRACARFLGFDDDADMRDVVRWHLDRLA